MPSPSPLQCLFCNHLNPGGSSFCNDCGSQLHLQQCDLCGSINKRSARICYKCGVTFTHSAAHGVHPVVLDHEAEGGALDYLGAVNDFTTLPESIAQAISTTHRKLQADGTESGEYADRAEAADNTLKNHSGECSSVKPPPPPDETRPSSGGMAATRLRYRYLIALSVIVLAASVVWVYFDHGLSKKRWTEPVAEQAVPSLSSDSNSSSVVPSARVEQVEASSAPAGTKKNFAFRILGLESEPAPAPSDAATETKKPALTVTDSEISDHPAPKDCQDAIVALGLCNSIQSPERH